MEVTKEIIRTMNYVRETSYRTIPKEDEYFVEYDRNKECFNLDYSNLRCSRTNLTNEKFIPNKYFDFHKMYKTGDLAKWLPDGDCWRRLSDPPTN